MLSCRGMAPCLSTHSPTACGGKVVAPDTKGGRHFQRPQGGCPVFAAKGGIYTGAPKGAVPPQWNGTLYLPRAEPSTRPGGVSRSRTEPLAPRARGPAAPSTLTPVRACQPSGILESTAPVPIPIPTAPKALESSSPKGACPSAIGQFLHRPKIFLNPLSSGFFVRTFHRESMKSSGRLNPIL